MAPPAFLSLERSSQAQLTPVFLPPTLTRMPLPRPRSRSIPDWRRGTRDSVSGLFGAS